MREFNHCQSYNPGTESTLIGGTTIPHADFVALYSQMMCKNKAAWSHLHSFASENREPLAQAILAIGYREGWFSKNESLSREYATRCLGWLRSQQDKCAFFCLGKLCCLGVVGPGIIVIEGEHYMKMAAEAGCQLAQYCLGKMELGAGAVKWYRLSAEQGYCAAQYELGQRCYYGLGTKKSCREAVKWYRLSAEQGYCDAQYMLGFWFDHGVVKDKQEAIKWYRRAAAEHGHSKSQCMLGSNFRWGDSRDYVEAAGWLRLSADQGNDYAQLMLAECYQHGHGVPKSLEQTVKWYQLAADQGNENAINTLESDEFMVICQQLNGKCG